MTTTICKCGGKSLWIVNESGRAERCACWRSDARVQERLGFYGLSEREVFAAFAPWNEKNAQGSALANAPKELLEWAIQARPTPWACCLLGAPGRGKTKFAAMMAAERCRHDGVLHWQNCEEPMSRIDLLDLDRLLVLDDLGAGGVEVYGRIVTARERRGLPTLITANATSVGEIFNDDRLSSRLSSALVVVMVGADARTV